jgi:histidinol-phosphate aminotransferase
MLRQGEPPRSPKARPEAAGEAKAWLQARPGIFRFEPHMRDLPMIGGAEGSSLLASNECALGPSPRTVEAGRQAMAYAHLYPEAADGSLRAAIAAHFDLDEARIACGHGSDDLLCRLAHSYLRPGEELVYNAGGYQKFAKYALTEDAEPVAAAGRDLRADVDAILERVSTRTRIVMLANPDNPSGCALSGAEVRRLHAGLRQDVLLVLDSAYAEYVDADDYELPNRLVECADNVVMTRTFSKIFGLAGVRLGWLYGTASIVAAVRKVGVTYAITAPSAAAGIAALQDHAHTEAVRAHNRRWRARLTRELTALGLHVFPSQTNFVMVRFDDREKTAGDAHDFLVARGAVPRLFTGRTFADYLRITIGPEADLGRFLAALREFLTKG